MTNTLPIKDISSLSELVAKSVMIESYIESRLFLAKISKEVSRSIILEAVDDDQKAEDADILDTNKNLAAAIQGSGLSAAASFAIGIENALRQYDSKIGQPGFNGSKEQTQMYNTARGLIQFNNGLAKAVISIYNSKKSGKTPSKDILSNFFANKYLSSIKGAQLDTKALIDEIIAADEKTLSNISSKIKTTAEPASPPENEKPGNEEKINDEINDEFMKKALEDDEFKNDFSIYMSAKNFGPISLDEFVNMIKANLIQGDTAKKFIEDFTKTAGKAAFEKLQGKTQ